MDRLDDYRDEMDALSSEEVEAVLSGRTPLESAAARAAALVTDLRGALREEPTSEVARVHLAAMVAAAEGSGFTNSRRSSVPMPSRRRIGGLAVAATLVVGGGLAAAVTQPEAVTRPEETDDRVPEAIGQGPEEAGEASAHGKAVAAVAQGSALEGCEKGQAVAGAASSKATENRQDDADRPDPCAGGDREGSAGDEGDRGGGGNGNGRGKGASAFGRGIAEEARTDGRAFGQQTAAEAQGERSGFGHQTAEQASGGSAGGGDQGGSLGEAPEGAGPPPGTPGAPPGGSH
jgi:hypothetical protein